MGLLAVVAQNAAAGEVSDARAVVDRQEISRNIAASRELVRLSDDELDRMTAGEVEYTLSG